MNQRDVVGEYARLRLAAKTYAANGRPVPFEIRQEIQAIEDRASQLLTPQQRHNAMAHVAAAEARILGEEQSQRAERLGRGADDVMRGLTRGMLGRDEGLTRAQLAQLRGGDKVAFKGKGEVFDPVKADRKVREQTRHLDPEGKGFGLKEWERRMDELANADDAKFAKLAKNYKATPTQLRESAGRWSTDRYEFELRRRHASPTPPKDEVVAVRDDDRRRAEIITNYVGKVEDDDPQQMNQMFDAIPGETMTDEGMRGDVARAFADVEERDNGNEP